MPFKLDFCTTGVIASFAAYILFYTLFVAGQLWWGFALIATGFYFVPLLYAVQMRQKGMMLICLILHLLATLGQLAWTIFFFVEIFANNTIIINWLKAYTKNSSNPKDVARYGCIAMSADGFITFVIMLGTAGLCYEKWRRLAMPKIEELPSRNETLAVTELDFPEIAPIPRLRTTSVGMGIVDLPQRPNPWSSSASARYSRHIQDQRF